MASPATAPADTSGTSSSDASSATISANDFLTLLVTEMQNQDPTADTDPNEYINQLVNVNSLEQLIDINQNLSTALGDSSTSANGAGSAQTAGAASALTGANSAGTTPQAASAAHKGGTFAAAQAAAASGAGSGNLAALSSAAKRTPGNLSVPAASPASQSVAHALDGRSHARSTTGAQ
jgi:flagellar basal-body rod modification protein FlgD